MLKWQEKHNWHALSAQIKSLQIRAIRAVNNSSLKAHSDSIIFRLELLNLDDTYKLGVLSFIQFTLFYLQFSFVYSGPTN